MIGSRCAIPVNSVLLEFAFSGCLLCSLVTGHGVGGCVGRLVVYCGSGIVNSAINVDLVLVSELLFSRKCSHKSARLHIRVISEGMADISDRVINGDGGGNFC